MLLEIVRRRGFEGRGFTPGQFFIDSVFVGVTLEDEDREIAGQPVASWKIARETCVQCGEFDVTIDVSTRFKKRMLHILDVDGFSGVRIHGGNDAADTEGCPLVGEHHSEDFSTISNCAPVVDKIFEAVDEALKRGETVRIKIRYEDQ